MRSPRSFAPGGMLTAGTPASSVSSRPTAAVKRGRAGAGLRDQDRCELGLVGVGEVALDGASHDVRPGAGYVEAASRQVLGLAQRERDRDHDDHEPQYGDQPTAPLEESRQPECCPLHRSTVPL